MSPNKFEENFKRRYKRLKRRLRMAQTPGNSTEASVQNVAKQLLQEFNWMERNPFPIPSHEARDAASDKLRMETKQDQMEIKNILYDELPAASVLLYEGCFNHCTYHCGIIHDIAQLFEFGDIPQASWASLHLRESDRQDPKLVQMIWIAEFLNVPDDDIMQLILQYRDSNKIRTKRQPQKQQPYPFDPHATQHDTNLNNHETRSMNA